MPQTTPLCNLPKLDEKQYQVKIRSWTEELTKRYQNKIKESKIDANRKAAEDFFKKILTEYAKAKKGIREIPRATEINIARQDAKLQELYRQSENARMTEISQTIKEVCNLEKLLLQQRQQQVKDFNHFKEQFNNHLNKQHFIAAPYLLELYAEWYNYHLSKAPDSNQELQDICENITNLIILCVHKKWMSLELGWQVLDYYRSANAKIFYQLEIDERSKLEKPLQDGQLAINFLQLMRRNNKQLSYDQLQAARENPNHVALMVANMGTQQSNSSSVSSTAATAAMPAVAVPTPTSANPSSLGTAFANLSIHHSNTTSSTSTAAAMTTTATPTVAASVPNVSATTSLQPHF
jgi:hypothetical protein